MKASIVDLRYKMNEVLKALDRNERVQILYHGKIKGIITPPLGGVKKKIKDHPFFGMSKKTQKTVAEEMDKLRGARHVV